MILITKRGTPPEQLVHEATCTHCKTEYEFTRDEAKYISDQRDGDCLKTTCPVCKREVFTAANKGSQMTDQNQLMREALESYEHAIANGHREHDALSAFDGISVPDLVRRVLAITNPQDPARVGGVPEGWTDRHRNIVCFALHRFAAKSRSLSNMAAQKSWEGHKDDHVKFAADAKDADEALAMLTAAPQAPAAVVHDTQLEAVKAEFNQAINFAISEGIGAAVFLEAWRCGDTKEWPEFATMSTKAGGV